MDKNKAKQPRSMQAAPALPSVLKAPALTPHAREHIPTHAAPSLAASLPEMFHSEPLQMTYVADGYLAGAFAAIAQSHESFLAHTEETHRAFLQQRSLWVSQIAGANVVSYEAPREVAEQAYSHSEMQTDDVDASVPALWAPAMAVPVSAPRPTTVAQQTLEKKATLARGESFSRAQLLVHSQGNISEIFGAQFRAQDEHDVVTRMPMEPLLLADRVTGIVCDEKGRLGKGTVWTETDVQRDSWYVDEHLRMPPGVMIESGQADLFLISYMGIDLLNRGERAYRLLGCELTYHRSPARAGETLAYDIHVDGHANQGAVRLFFFHYDCHIGGAPALSVRSGQAGFFTKEELKNSAGVLWRPETQEVRSDARMDAAPQLTQKRSFTDAEVDAFSRGDAYACFGPGFKRAAAHTMTPKITAGEKRFLHTVDSFEPEGGPWQRGYLRATTQINPNEWYFPGHFKNDPCMPGTLMFDGCLQAMAFYLAALGTTLQRDGWRFEPVTGEAYKLLCRGQVTPQSKVLVYEIFIEEFVAGPEPILYADLLCTVDGLGAFHARRMGLKLVRDWPMESAPWFDVNGSAPPSELDGVKSVTFALAQPRNEKIDTRVCARGNGPSDGFVFDYASLLACAWGKPSLAFGKMYERFDGHRQVARLPSPPYHFMSRITSVVGPTGVAQPGSEVTCEYDVPRDAWYFDDAVATDQEAHMPFGVLLEVALQPCGWLSSYVGSALLSDEDLLFRNLDGQGKVHKVVTPETGLLTTHVKLTAFSKNGPMMILSFAVDVRDRSESVYTITTVFGFFPQSAFENQAGLPVAPRDKELLALTSDAALDGTPRLYSRIQSEHGFRTFDAVEYFAHCGEQSGSPGSIRTVQSVDPYAWYFKAHFFSDPVQPGSFGIEAIRSALVEWMLRADVAHNSDVFEALAVGADMVWKYRGQVTPLANEVHATVDVTEIRHEDGAIIAVCDGSLWVDRKRIYQAKGLAVRSHRRDSTTPTLRQKPFTSASTPPANNELVRVFDLKTDSWLSDHAPTYTRAALPATALIDLGAQVCAKVYPQMRIQSFSNARFLRWAVVDDSLSLRARLANPRTEQEGVRVDIVVESTESASAFAMMEALLTEAPLPSAPTWTRRSGGSNVAPSALYQELFHGAQFQRVDAAETWASSSWVHIQDGVEPVGARMRPIALDAALHGIPHADLFSWSQEIPRNRAAYPLSFTRIEFFGTGVPAKGAIESHAAFLRFDGNATIVLTWMQNGNVFARAELVEVLLPKGPVGALPGLQRRAFLTQQEPAIPTRGLSDGDGDERSLSASTIALSNFFPGTVEAVYGASDPFVIAAKDLIAEFEGTHPSQVTVGPEGASWVAVSNKRPLSKTMIAFSTAGDRSTARRVQTTLDHQRLVHRWREILNIKAAWPGEALMANWASQFVEDVVLDAPSDLATFARTPVLFLANHQVGVESLMFGLVAGALLGRSCVTVAKKEHKTTWLGELIEQTFSYPGIARVPVIVHLDRERPEHFLELAKELSRTVGRHKSSILVHVEGTRAHRAAEPVTQVSGAILDLAVALSIPICPVRFSGGLSHEGTSEKAEFPYQMGKQRIHLGKLIEPKAFASLPLKERKELVVREINRAGGGVESDRPCVGDVEFVRAVQKWQQEFGVAQPWAALGVALRDGDSRHPEIDAALQLAPTSDFSRWLAAKTMSKT